MGVVITFGNFKGGTGKTTNSAMIGYEMAREGKKVCLIDMDPQANATNLYLKTKAYIDGEIVIFEKTLMNGIQEGTLEKLKINICDNLDLIPSAADFSLFPRYMEKISDYTERAYFFNSLIEEMKKSYDFILIDTPPTIGLITDSALIASDYCIIVLQTQERSLQGAFNFIEYIQNTIIDDYQAPRLDVLGILPVLLKNGAPVDISTLDAAKNELGSENFFDNTIKNMERLKRFDLTGITDDDLHDKRVHKKYTDVANEVMEKIKERENESSEQ